MSQRVVITGMGLVTPCGVGKDAFWSALMEGRGGVDRITRFDVSKHPSKTGGEVTGFEPSDYMPRTDARRTYRYAQFAVASSRMAIDDAGMDVAREKPDRVATIVGTSLPGVDFIEKQYTDYLRHGIRKVSPYLAAAFFSGCVSSQVAMDLKVTGTSLTISTGCPSGADAMIVAVEKLRSGQYDVVLAGGSEAPLTPMCLASFCVIKATSRLNDEPTTSCRPFDRTRDGFVLGEGAAMLVFEELTHALDRGARIYAEIVGYGTSCDAFHLTRPEPSGKIAGRAVRDALVRSGVCPDEVDYINAHGSSTPINDKTETLLIKRIFGDHAHRLAVSSTKSATSHCLGATPAIELAACSLAIERGRIPPTINYQHPDPECDLDYVPNRARQADVRLVVSNSFGFGGKNAAIVLRRYTDGAG